MSAEGQLKKLQEETSRLEEELELLNKASSAKNACEAIINFVGQKEEAFSKPESNPWAQPLGPGPCCVIL